MTKYILDPASSMRAFYFDKEDKRVIFGDIREHEEHTLTNGQFIKIKPDKVMDFRKLSYPDNTFKAVIFDPPHILGASPKADMFKKYGGLDKETWQEDLTAGFTECFRVLEEFGTLIFKWTEIQIKLKDVLKLTKHKPIIGHRSGAKMRTHWVLFIKDKLNG